MTDTASGDDPTHKQRIEECLPDLLRSQRWFAGKSDASLTVQVDDIVQVSTDGYELALVSVHGESATSSRTYVVPLQVSETVVESSDQPDFWQALLQRLLSESGGIATARGQFLSLTSGPGIGRLESFNDSTSVAIHSGEQSNTSVVIGNGIFLKLFRKVEPGINPDAEIATHLSQTEFDASPEVVATIDLTGGDSAQCIALLSEKIDAEADAWTTTLAELSSYWTRVAADKEADVQSLCGEFPRQVAELGKATAEMHSALAGNADDAFRPEPFNQSQLEELTHGVGRELSETCRLLRDAELEQIDVVRLASDVESAGQAELQRLSALQLSGEEVHVIRCHGDYHLGQVLWTGAEWKIIDFEGEPDRPLPERREKRCALKDVASMVRSFHYASNAGSVGLIDPPAATIESPEEFRDAWYRAVRDEFLTAWRRESDGAVFAPADDGLYHQLLDLFVLEKVLYELRYELQNRPDWIAIPLTGLVHVLRVSVDHH